MLITFEGIDYCGKSVQLELLAQKIVNQHKPVVIIREPGGTLISEKIRDVLLNREHKFMNPVTEMLLYNAARAQLIQEKILPNLREGKIILCDRFYDSTTAYQGYGRGIDLNLIQQVNQLATQHISPDITFLLDIELDEVVKRQQKSKAQLDRMESENRDFFERVKKGFLAIAEANPRRFRVIDGGKSISEIEEIIGNYFWSHLQGGDHGT